MLSILKPESNIWFSVGRISIGLYLTFYFVFFYPHSEAVFSNNGIFNSIKLSYLSSYFPSVFFINDSPSFVNVIISISIFLSILLSLGIYRQIVSVLLWYLWASFYVRNPLIFNPSIPIVGWLLLFLTVVPHGEPLTIYPKSNYKWKLNITALKVIWIILAISQSSSGISKLLSHNWLNGKALSYLLKLPHANANFMTEFLSKHTFISILLTYLGLLVQCGFVLAVWWNYPRKIFWLMTVLMHLFILIIFDFGFITYGSILIHIFTINSSWNDR